jgi:hypothetical protein
MTGSMCRCRRTILAINQIATNTLYGISDWPLVVPLCMTFRFARVRSAPVRYHSGPVPTHRLLRSSRPRWFDEANKQRSHARQWNDVINLNVLQGILGHRRLNASKMITRRDHSKPGMSEVATFSPIAHIHQVSSAVFRVCAASCGCPHRLLLHYTRVVCT